MTLTTMLADLYRRLNFQSSPAAAVTTRLTAFINETIYEITSLPGIGDAIALNGPVTFASVANQATYGLPQSVKRVIAITDRTNDARLGMRTFDWYRTHEPDPTANTATPVAWIPIGHARVHTQPSAAGELSIKSTVAGDTTQVATVVSIRSNGLPVTVTATLNGLAAVNFLFADHTEVVDFFLSAVPVGAVTLHQGSGGTGAELGLIATDQTMSHYQRIALWPTPSAVLTYHVDYERNMFELTAGNDEPPFDRRFHRLVVLGARAKEYEKMNDSRYEIAKREYDQGLGELRYYVHNPPDYLPVMGQGRRPAKRSRLGPYYPAEEAF